MTSMVAAISKMPAPAAMRLVPANCPVPVKFVKETSTGNHAGKPALIAEMAYAKATETYPSAIGSPSFNPFVNLIGLPFEKQSENESHYNTRRGVCERIYA